MRSEVRPQITLECWHVFKRDKIELLFLQGEWKVELRVNKVMARCVAPQCLSHLERMAHLVREANSTVREQVGARAFPPKDRMKGLPHPETRIPLRIVDSFPVLRFLNHCQQRIFVSFPALFARQVMRQFERDCCNLTIDSGP